MKKLIMCIALCLVAGTIVCNAQSFAQMKAQAKSELSTKAVKAARKEAKNATKEGWKNAPGSLPIDKQFERSMVREEMEDPETGALMFFKGDAMSPGAVYDAAKRQAIELAKNQIAGQIESNMAEIVKNSVSNEQLGADEAASVAKTISESRSLIQQKMGSVQPMVELYRDLANKNKEVRVIVLLNRKQLEKQAKATVREQLKKENEELGKKLDEKLGW